MSKYASLTNPIGSRLRAEMKKQVLTSAELSRRADVLTSFIYDVISGKSTNPSIVKLSRIADALDISLTYLVRGEEKNNESKSYSMEKDNYVNIPCIMLSSSTSNDSKITSYEDKNIPYYFSREWIRSHLNTEITNLRIMIINGDGMEPTLYHQDIVLVDISKKAPSPPSIFIISDGLGITAKRLEYFTEPRGKRIRVISDNKHYLTYECSISDVTVIGRVVWFSREI